MKKKIVITGGLGYIGTELCKLYSGVSWHHRIIVIDNRFISERVNQIRNWNMEFIQADILDKNLIKKYCEDADVVHHLAGITDVPRTRSEASLAQDEKIKEVGEKVTQNILDVISDSCKIIFPSTHVVYEGIDSVKTEISESEETKPVLSYSSSKAINEMNEKYVGFLYAGLMIKNNEPYLIEYNVRMGDPECQTILPLIDSDLLEIIDACCNSKLVTQDIKWKNKKSMCIVLCSKGYPENYSQNVEIENLKEFKSTKDNFIFHAGTKSSENKILAVGGRVINFVNISDKYSSSRKEIINQIKKLNWENGFYRSDIGHKVIDK